MNPRREDALLAEIERLKAALDDRRRAEESASNEVERLKAELACLTPSGQVAEDVAMVEAVFIHACPLMPETGPCPHRTALSRIAAKAQSYEAAMAAHSAAEKRWETCEAERIAAVEQHDEWQRRALDRDLQAVTLTTERDAAVADNAALLQFAGTVMKATHPWAWIEERARTLVCAAHPGAALLKEKQEQAETIKALTEALTDSLPPERCFGCWCPPSRDVERAGHQPPCERARAALRRAGSLP